MSQFCSNRFECITRMVPEDARVLAEIGYDHGQILLRAARKLPAPAQIIGVEKQSGAARRFTDRHGHNPWIGRIDLRCGSGLAPLRDDEFDTIVLAGLGEGRICEILGADVRRLQRVRSLLCMPLQRQGRLEPFLRECGFEAVREDAAIERGRYYPLTQFVPARSTLRARSPR